MTDIIEACIREEGRIADDHSSMRSMAVATYELGMVAGKMVYASVDKANSTAYIADAMLEIADVITQMDVLRFKLLAEHPDLKFEFKSFEQLRELGRERMMSKLREKSREKAGRSN